MATRDLTELLFKIGDDVGEIKGRLVGLEGIVSQQGELLQTVRDHTNQLTCKVHSQQLKDLVSLTERLHEESVKTRTKHLLWRRLIGAIVCVVTIVGSLSAYVLYIVDRPAAATSIHSVQHVDKAKKALP